MSPCPSLWSFVSACFSVANGTILQIGLVTKKRGFILIPSWESLSDDCLLPEPQDDKNRPMTRSREHTHLSCPFIKPLVFNHGVTPSVLIQSQSPPKCPPLNTVRLGFYAFTTSPISTGFHHEFWRRKLYFNQSTIHLSESSWEFAFLSYWPNSQLTLRALEMLPFISLSTLGYCHRHCSFCISSHLHYQILL